MTRPKHKTMRKSMQTEKDARSWNGMPKHARKFYLDRKKNRNKKKDY